MSIDLNKLRSDHEKAEKRMYDLQAKKDEAAQKLRDQYAEPLREAIDQAATAQKALLDAEVAVSLADREDGASVARGLIEQGALSQDVVEAAGIELD